MTRWLWLCLCMAAMLLCAQPDAEAQWKAFLAWLSSQPPDSKPANLIRPYRAELIRKGMSPVEAERELDRLGHLAFTRPDGAKVLWNKVYGGHDPIFIQTPNALLASAIEGRKPGKALDFGMGQGRNTIFLAMQGWDVTGFDPSDEGVRLAQANAAKAGVQIRALVATDDQFDFGVAPFGGGEATGVTSHHDHTPILRRAVALGRRRLWPDADRAARRAPAGYRIRQNAQARRGARHR